MAYAQKSAKLRRSAVALIAAGLASWLAPTSFGSVDPAQALPGVPDLRVSPDKGLVDGSVARVRISGGAHGTTYVIAVCDTKALNLVAEGSPSLQDACDSRHNTLVAVDSKGDANTELVLPAVLTTALGEADCRHTRCFIAAVPLHSSGLLRLPLLSGLDFASTACAKAGACQPAPDAWSPSLGRAHEPTKQGAPGPPTVIPLSPVEEGDLTAPGSVTGPYTGQLEGLTTPATPAPTAAPAPTATPATPARRAGAGPSLDGEGLLRLAMEAPATSWGPGPPSSTVVDATVSDVTTGKVVSTQQFVLFYGARPFVYAGFVGPVEASHHYQLSVCTERPAAEGGLSQPAPHKSPRAVLLAESLGIVPPANPQYLAYAYSPVIFGRSTSALHDVPLLDYATVGPAPGGGHVLNYVVVWSHEDGGTGFLPFLEWGKWGRMTDIETSLSVTIAPDGQMIAAKYLWGGEPLTGFPDSQTALAEKYEPLTGTWWGDHPVLRDATGNNDFSDRGTSAFRFQLAPVGAPGSGQTRDAVMDANPFTYQVMSDEIARWYQDTSNSPVSPEEGAVGQYAIIDMSTTGRQVASVAVDILLSGYSSWFRSDLGWGYPLTGTGHVRTVVKLPLGWPSHAITAVEVTVEPQSAAASASVQSFHIERFTGSVVAQVPSPAPTVVSGKTYVRPSAAAP